MSCKDTQINLSVLPTATALATSDYFVLASGKRVSYSTLLNAVGNSSIQHYTTTSSSVTCRVVADGLGVTMSATSGTFTVDIPASVNIKSLLIHLPQTLTSAGTLTIKLDYTNSRSYNTDKFTLNLPICAFGNDNFSTPSVSSPVLYNELGGSASGTIVYGVSQFGHGDGSDLDITIKNFTLGSDQWVFMNFAR